MGLNDKDGADVWSEDNSYLQGNSSYKFESFLTN
jgi:hypothetical protein